MHTLTLLDCTLRDGGYYNDWKFKKPYVEKYIRDISNANIDVIEIGFHFFEKQNDYGDYAYIDNSILKKINFKKNKKLALMFNGNDFLKNKNLTIKKLNQIFNTNKNQFDIVRIAIHLKDFKKMRSFLDYFKKKNLKTCLNLMQINLIKKKELIDCINTLNKWQNVDVFYFADSFGNLNLKKVEQICSTIKKNWKKEFGIHAHDNCGLALKNSIKANKCGATWVDGTIQGMGRGAGNTKTEDLLSYFEEKNYFPKKIKNISEKYFLSLKKQYNWGPSKFYKIAAKFNIHPTYIQLILQDKRYSSSEQNELIKYLSKIDSKKFDPNFLTNFHSIKKINKKWNANNWCLNRNILLLGQGSSLRSVHMRKKIEKFILIKKPLVISININKFILNEFIDYYVSCHDGRILVDHKKYNSLNKKIILPLDILKSFSNFEKNNSFLDYGIKIKLNEFKCFDKYTILPFNESLGYAIALSIIGGSRDIFLAGVDGYEKNHNANIKTQKLLKLVKKKYPYINLKTLTKTSNQIDHFKV